MPTGPTQGGNDGSGLLAAGFGLFKRVLGHNKGPSISTQLTQIGSGERYARSGPPINFPGATWSGPQPKTPAPPTPPVPQPLPPQPGITAPTYPMADASAAGKRMGKLKKKKRNWWDVVGWYDEMVGQHGAFGIMLAQTAMGGTGGLRGSMMPPRNVGRAAQRGSIGVARTPARLPGEPFNELMQKPWSPSGLSDFDRLMQMPRNAPKSELDALLEKPRASLTRPQSSESNIRRSNRTTRAPARAGGASGGGGLPLSSAVQLSGPQNPVVPKGVLHVPDSPVGNAIAADGSAKGSAPGRPAAAAGTAGNSAASAGGKRDARPSSKRSSGSAGKSAPAGRLSLASFPETALAFLGAGLIGSDTPRLRTQAASPGRARSASRGLATLTNFASQGCDCHKGTVTRHRKPRKPRTVCFKGTYYETATGLRKQKRELISCTDFPTT